MSCSELFFAALFVYGICYFFCGFLPNYLMKSDLSTSEKNIESNFNKVNDSFSDHQLDPDLSSVKDSNVESSAHKHRKGNFSKSVSIGSVHEQKIKIIKNAIRSNLKVGFDYKDKHGNRSHRMVTPIDCPFEKYGPLLCFHAFCHLRHSDRTFAFARIENLKLMTKD